MASAGAVAGCAEFVLYRYQTIIGIGGAIAAALIAARPVWRQLAEMARQSDGQALEYLRHRSVELDREQSLIYEIASSIDNCMQALVSLHTTRQNPGGMFPPAVAQFKGTENYMNERIMKCDRELGPMWGGVAIHEARIRIKEDAQRLSVALNKFSAKVIPNAPITDAEFDLIGRQLAPYKNSVFEAATFVHEGIVKERKSVGSRISLLETRL